MISKIVERKASFRKWGHFSSLEIMEIKGFNANMGDPDYKATLRSRFIDRREFVNSRKNAKGGFDRLPEEVLECFDAVINELGTE